MTLDSCYNLLQNTGLSVILVFSVANLDLYVSLGYLFLQLSFHVQIILKKL
jgi:hypothetical protein